jgi:hypothetical protein
MTIPKSDPTKEGDFALLVGDFASTGRPHGSLADLERTLFMQDFPVLHLLSLTSSHFSLSWIK